MLFARIPFNSKNISGYRTSEITSAGFSGAIHQNNSPVDTDLLDLFHLL